MIQKRDLLSCRPTKCEEWCDIAIERGKDATIMLNNQREIAAVYMAGYVIEFYLKAYLTSRKVAFSTSGQGGHDLLVLWNKSELTYKNISDKGEAFNFFIRRWSTGMRYCRNDSCPVNAQELVEGSKILAGIIAKAIKRSRKRF